MKPKLKILFLSRWFPYPFDNGSKIRIFNLIEQLALCHEVDLISFIPEPLDQKALSFMKQYCARVTGVIYRPFHPTRLKSVLGFLSSRPRSVRDTFNPEMAAMIRQASAIQRYDLVIASQVDMAPYALFADGAARVLEEIELTTLYEQKLTSGRGLDKVRRSLMWWKWAKYLAALLRSFDGATVVSEIEQKRVQAAASLPLPVRVIPNGVSISAMSGDFGPPQDHSLVFSGALTYGPNLEAMQYFLGEIYPQVQEQIPAIRISITGHQDPTLVSQLPRKEGVNLTGFLEDIRPVVARSWASVVPLRTGGGTRLKVLEALALGTPVVSTPKGVEGLDLTAGRDFLLGEDPASFAGSLLRLLQDPLLRTELSRRGRIAVSERYDWARIGPCLCDFVEEISEKKREKINGNSNRRP